MLIAQITDMHVREEGQLCYGRVATSDFLAKAVARLRSLSPRPDVVLVTGDLVDRATIAEYTQFRTLMAPLAVPYFLVMGNHDSRENLRKVFADHTHLLAGKFVQYTVEQFAVRIIVLDTNIPGQGTGALCAERLAWLDARLSEQPARPTVIAMHHPPFRTGNALMDRFDLAGTEELAAVVSKFRNVEAICCGHLHRPTQTRFAGTVAMTCPSTAHQHHFGLGDSPFAFDMEPPSFQLHAWNGRSLITHTVLVDGFDGPHPYEHRSSPIATSPVASS